MNISGNIKMPNINLFANKNIYLCLNMADDTKRVKKWQNVDLSLAKSSSLVKSIENIYKWYKLGNINAVVSFNVPYISNDNADNILINALINAKWIELIYKSLNFVFNNNKNNENDYEYPYKNIDNINSVEKIEKLTVWLNDRIAIKPRKYDDDTIRLEIILESTAPNK